MIRHIVTVIVAAFILSSCSNPTEEQQTKNLLLQDTNKVEGADDCYSYLRKAKDADNTLLNATSINKSEAEKALVAFNNFSSFCMRDSLAPVFLLKGGQVAQSIGKYIEAETMLRKCVNDFPRFESRGAALFLLAQLYDDGKMLNNEAEAKIIYQKIIKEYPQSPFANDAKACLANLGKSDEQLIQEFLKKNK